MVTRTKQFKLKGRMKRYGDGCYAVVIAAGVGRARTILALQLGASDAPD